MTEFDLNQFIDRHFNEDQAEKELVAQVKAHLPGELLAELNGEPCDRDGRIQYRMQFGQRYIYLHPFTGQAGTFFYIEVGGLPDLDVRDIAPNKLERALGLTLYHIRNEANLLRGAA